MCSNKEAMTYRDAGVDIDAGNKAVELMKAACFGFISTDVTFWQPREANSKEIEPIPAKRSIPLYFITLNFLLLIIHLNFH